ncbi:hypothetical protein D1155_08275 [Anaerotruncus sp. 80]|uniref:DUF4367 domain-containing protein n=1 Tax=Anaerotruncus colihominis TaxID=169435 RepID=A0A845QLM7_9FIRM|nr:MULTISPECIES: hypothetical protein [Anaerotruncus]NBH61643.1 hypothetical protein [Anaerotruncus colihominis]NCF02298.1 hypothetical protein [Anaerotruncus sp. 80]
MNGKDLLTAMSYLEEESVAELFTWERNAKRKPPRSLKGIGVLAACICIAVIGVFLHGKGSVVSPETEMMHVQLSAIALNEIDGLGGDRKIHLPNHCIEEVWDREAVAAYFGRNLQPAYIPEGLKESPNNDKKTVFMLGEKPYLDEVSLDFYHGFYADGMPMWTEDAAAEKGFTLTAWRRGLTRDYLWISEDDRLEVSIIGDTEVTFGYRAMEYGPYDEKTHAPAGTYDLYVATFTMEGVHYEIVSHQLPLSELVKVVTSFICETDQVVVE